MGNDEEDCGKSSGNLKPIRVWKKFPEPFPQNLLDRPGHITNSNDSTLQPGEGFTQILHIQGGIALVDLNAEHMIIYPAGLRILVWGWEHGGQWPIDSASDAQLSQAFLRSLAILAIHGEMAWTYRVI